MCLAFSVAPGFGLLGRFEGMNQVCGSSVSAPPLSGESENQPGEQQKVVLLEEGQREKRVGRDKHKSSVTLSSPMLGAAKLPSGIRETWRKRQVPSEIPHSGPPPPGLLWAPEAAPRSSAMP